MQSGLLLSLSIGALLERMAFGAGNASHGRSVRTLVERLFYGVA